MCKEKTFLYFIVNAKVFLIGHEYLDEKSSSDYVGCYKSGFIIMLFA